MYFTNFKSRSYSYIFLWVVNAWRICLLAGKKHSLFNLICSFGAILLFLIAYCRPFWSNFNIPGMLVSFVVPDILLRLVVSHMWFWWVWAGNYMEGRTGGKYYTESRSFHILGKLSQTPLDPESGIGPIDALLSTRLNWEQDVQLVRPTYICKLRSSFFSIDVIHLSS